jgi:hypothetical protein
VVRVVEGAVAEHGVEDVAAASGEGDQGLVVSFALSDLAVVVGAGDRVAEGGERGEEQRPFRARFPRWDDLSPRIEVPERGCRALCGDARLVRPLTVLARVRQIRCLLSACDAARDAGGEVLLEGGTRDRNGRGRQSETS